MGDNQWMDQLHKLYHNRDCGNPGFSIEYQYTIWRRFDGIQQWSISGFAIRGNGNQIPHPARNTKELTSVSMGKKHLLISGRGRKRFYMSIL